MNENTLRRLETQLEVIPGLLAGASEESVEARTVSGQWSARENLAHLARYHAVFLERLRQMLEEDSPKFGRHRAEEDSALARVERLTLEEILARMKVLREEIVGLVSSLSRGKNQSHRRPSPLRRNDCIRLGGVLPSPRGASSLRRHASLGQAKTPTGVSESHMPGSSAEGPRSGHLPSHGPQVGRELAPVMDRVEEKTPEHLAERRFPRDVAVDDKLRLLPPTRRRPAGPASFELPGIALVGATDSARVAGSGGMTKLTSPRSTISQASRSSLASSQTRPPADADRGCGR